MDYSLSHGIRSLPTDQEMIDRFRRYRSDFGEMANEIAQANYVYMVTLNRKWIDRHGILMAQALASYPQTPDDKAKNVLRTWAYSFTVESTLYIKGASREDWPLVNRVKGYVYFRSPPQVEGGYLLGLPGHPKYLFRVLPSLDGPPWPSDWKSGECLLRKIEPQWFLSLCRDRVGG